MQRLNRGRCALRLDANQGYSREDAIRFVTSLDPDAIELFEQPCDKADWDSAVAVARVSNVPMMLDESIYGRRRYCARRAARCSPLRQAQADESRIGRCASARSHADTRAWHGTRARKRRRDRREQLDGGVRRTRSRDECVGIERIPQAAPLGLATRRSVSRAARSSWNRSGRRRSMRPQSKRKRRLHGMPGLGRTLVTGVIGSDTHIVGNRILRWRSRTQAIKSFRSVR